MVLNRCPLWLVAVALCALSVGCAPGRGTTTELESPIAADRAEPSEPSRSAPGSGGGNRPEPASAEAPPRQARGGGDEEGQWPDAERGDDGKRSGAASIAVERGLVKIRRAPRWDAPLAGLLRAGQSVQLRGADPIVAAASGGCRGGWYAIEPEGYVCHDGDTSLDPSSVGTRAASDAQPRRSEDYPLHYGVSRGAPRYTRLPTAAEQRRAEPWLRGRATAAESMPGSPSGATPPSASAAASSAVDAPTAALRAWLSTRTDLRDPLDAYPTMKLAWGRELEQSGRRFLLTPELLLVPADRVDRAAEVGRLGLELVQRPALRMPFAIVVKQSPRLSPDGMARGGSFRRGEVLRLDDCVARSGSAPSTARGRPTLEPSSGGGASHDATARASTPARCAADGRYRKGLLVTTGGDAVATDAAVRFDPVARPAGIGEHDKWVLVRVNEGTLVAFEGDRPVYAAPISAGVHGVTDGELRTNPGRFRISSKSITADMGGEIGDGAWRSRDVPWVAYYDGSYALHGAWWHDSFGRPRSHGCVNLTPADARWLFEWLDPVLPEGWHGVVADPARNPGTLVIIRR